MDTKSISLSKEKNVEPRGGRILYRGKGMF